MIQLTFWGFAHIQALMAILLQEGRQFFLYTRKVANSGAIKEKTPNLGQSYSESSPHLYGVQLDSGLLRVLPRYWKL